MSGSISTRRRTRRIATLTTPRSVINGALPAKEFHLHEQTTWAVGFYAAYGKSTSVIGAFATWGIIAGLPD